ncbi:MAG: hypothetical protein KJ747_03225 [Actinobacteria bacterium]|nr:hypothetical protein [Actinomycetota bacterium]MCG2807288.1 hypothetical protein [Coriobacteriia bacterium]
MRRNRILLSLLFCLLALGVVACGQANDGHVVVGRWGVSTQSGVLVESLVFEPDGTFQVVDASGMGIQVGSASYRVIDESRVAAVEPIGPGGTSVEFKVVGERLTVTVGDLSAGEFRRMSDR